MGIDVELAFNATKDKVAQMSDDAPIFNNLPPTAGAIYWARCLHKRINDPMARLLLYNELRGEDDTKVVVFEPGSDIGIDADWDSGVVEEVRPGGQAERAGVKTGWKFHLLEDTPYSVTTRADQTIRLEDLNTP